MGTVMPGDTTDAAGAGLGAYDLVPPIELFRLPHSGVNNRTLGVRTGAGELVWKGYSAASTTASIEYEHHLLAWLSEANLSFRVPCPVPVRGGATLHTGPYGLQALFPRLAGSSPDPRNLTQVEAIGAALGELHATLSRYSTATVPDVPSFGDLHRIHPAVPDPFDLRPVHLALPKAPPHDMLLHWWRDELAALRPFVERAYRALPWQVIHGDFAPSNTLVAAGRVSAVLDFEFALPDARALDLASGLYFSMHELENPASWEVARRLCHGYGRWIRLTEAEAMALPWLMRLRNAVSSVWWSGRGLAAGDMRRAVQRMQAAQHSARWLREHGQRLVEVAVQEAG